MNRRLQIITIFVNTALVAGGISFIILGTCLWNKEQMILEYTTKFYLGGVVIGIGTFLVFVSSFGVIGVLVDFAPLLTWYAVALIILCIIQTGTAILALVEVMYVDQRLANNIEQSLHISFNSENRIKIGRVQQHFRCCGIHDAYYWIDDKKMDSLPLSCCKNYICHWGYYGKGCLEAATKSISGQFTITGSLLLVFAVVELLACCFACFSHRSTEEKDETYETQG